MGNTEFEFFLAILFWCGFTAVAVFYTIGFLMVRRHSKRNKDTGRISGMLRLQSEIEPRPKAWEVS